MPDGTSRTLQLFNELQGTIAVLLGILLQILMGEKKGVRIILTMATSAIFISGFVAPPLLDLVNVEAGSKLYNMALGLSAIVSIPLVAIIIDILPEAVRIRTKRFLGAENATSKD